jgi:hypothetical protein
MLPSSVQIIPAMSRKFLGALILMVSFTIGPLSGGEKDAISLKDLSGKIVEPLAKDGRKATVLFFLTTECPIGNLYSPEINRIVRKYKEQGIICHAVYAFETSEEITKHQREYKLSPGALLDPELKLASLTGATVTPEACVLGPGGKILYRGRIDDRAVKFGTVRLEPRVRDLRLALDAVLAGKPVAQKFTKPIGCYISFPEPPQSPLPNPSK